jgi:hypothetical protein
VGHVILAPMNGEPLARFLGHIECRFDGCGPLGLTLSGYTADRPQELVHLAFTGNAPADFPRILESPKVERLNSENYSITSGARHWTVSARAAHLHREVAAKFFEALPARPIRWTQRLFWRMVLALAATAAGRWLLRTVRGA